VTARARKETGNPTDVRTPAVGHREKGEGRAQAWALNQVARRAEREAGKKKTGLRVSWAAGLAGCGVLSLLFFFFSAFLF